jgi:hypothetical protein
MSIVIFAAIIIILIYIYSSDEPEGAGRPDNRDVAHRASYFERTPNNSGPSPGEREGARQAIQTIQSILARGVLSSSEREVARQAIQTIQEYEVRGVLSSSEREVARQAIQSIQAIQTMRDGHAKNATKEVRIMNNTEYTLDAAKQDLSTAQKLMELGLSIKSTEGTEHLNEAVAAIRRALKFFTRDEALPVWSALQNNLGAITTEIGKRLEGQEAIRHLNEAVAAFRSVLEFCTPDEEPSQWASTQNNLGAALKGIGTRLGGKDGASFLQEAIIAYDSALGVYNVLTAQDIRYSPEQEMTSNNKARAEATRNQLLSGVVSNSPDVNPVVTERKTNWNPNVQKKRRRNT